MSPTLFHQVHRYTLALLVCWSLVSLTIFGMLYLQNRDGARRYALESARESIQKDLVYRIWNAGQGGVYAVVSEKTQPNPYLAHLPYRDLATVDGKQLTLINPAYMTRQVHELASATFGSKGHITSLNPLRPENRPDSWEKEALHRFAQGEKEFSEVVENEGKTYLRTMIPLSTEERCLSCHADQGYQVGDLRGGLAVSKPMDSYLRDAAVMTRRHGLLLLTLWGIGTGIILFSSRQLSQRSRKEQQAKEQLIESERRYRQLFDNIDSAFSLYEVIYDAAGKPVDYRFLSVNPAFEKMTGTMAPKLIGCTSMEVLPSNEVSLLEEFGQVARSRTPHHFYHFSPNLDKYLGILVFSPEAGKIAVLANDITERIRAEIKIKESQQRFQDLVDNTSGIVWDLDLRTFCFTFISKSAESLFGYPLDDWYQPNFWVDHLHPDDRDQAVHFCMEQTKALQNHEFEYRMLARDGRYVWLRDLVSVRVVDGQPLTLSGVMIDITGTKQLLIQLKEFRSALDVSNDMVCVLDRDYRCVIANRTFLTMHNAEESQVLGQPLQTLLGSHDFAAVEPFLQRSFAGETVTFERQHDSPVHGQRHLFVHSTPMREKGEISQLVIVTRDVTAAKMAEQALAQSAHVAEAANRAKTEFLANMSHELRTPLNGILGMLQLLTMTELSEEQQKYIDPALRSGWSLLELLNDLLDLSCIEAGKLQIRREPFTLMQTIQNINDLFRVQIDEKQLDYTCHFESTIPATLRGDEIRIRQILFNLLGNAIKFTPAGGDIELKVSAGERVRPGILPIIFTITDNGIGIESDKLKTVFNPFVQGDNVYQKRYQGAGLGLAIVKRLLEAMNGDIQIESHPGSGTVVRVSISLPFVAATQGGESLRPEESVPLLPVQDNPCRVLLVEDNGINRIAFAALLGKCSNFVVATASNGMEALEKLAAADFDVVVMDIQMPVMDGLEALRHIRSGAQGVRNPAVPVIAMTAYAMESDRERFLQAGMDDYLSKPLQGQALVACINRVLARPFAPPY